MSIWIIDDESNTRILLQDLLEEAGFPDIVSFNTAHEALQKIEKETEVQRSNIDLFLMDVEMPGINGIDACKQIKSKEVFRDVPVIMLTVRSGVNDLKAAFEAGASDYITKPFRSIELMVRIRSALQLKREIDQRRKHEARLIQLTHKLQEANQTLERLSLMDGVTGIANRRFLDLVLDREWKRSIRHLLSFSLVMIDIDYFKHFNDTYGHQSGDDCLRKVGRALTGTLKRPGDLLGRYGGEEFLAVLPDTDYSAAFSIAQSLQESINALKIPHAASQTESHVTISLGLATSTPGQKIEMDELLSLADQALYKAKREGRNRIESSATPGKTAA
jgi:diguanylate cyclase (GGDEF)-like protein